MKFPSIELLILAVVALPIACSHNDSGAKSPSDQPGSGGVVGAAATGATAGTTDLTNGGTSTGGTTSTGETTGDTH